MNIDEAIDDLYTILGQHNSEYMDYASYEAAVDNLNIISNFVAGTRWIPVSERLPENGNTLLFLTKYDGVRMGHLMVDGWQTNNYINFSRTAVTHWMPLPQPPEQEV